MGVQTMKQRTIECDEGKRNDARTLTILMLYSVQCVLIATIIITERMERLQRNVQTNLS